MQLCKKTTHEEVVVASEIHVNAKAIEADNNEIKTSEKADEAVVIA